MNLQQFGLPGRYKNKTMSDVSKSIQKKYKDRNDHISKRTMEDELQRLANAQEAIKAETESPINNGNSFGGGGYADGYEDPELDEWVEDEEVGDNLYAASNPDEYSPSNPSSKDLFKFDSQGLNSALRLAPAAGNLLELNKIKDPEKTELSRLENRMKPELMSENLLRKDVTEQYGNINDKVAAASGGSSSAYRKNLLAAQLGKTKATSDALFKGRQYNNQQKDAAFRFNSGLDQYNAQQSDREQDIYARDKGATDNARHTLRQGVASNIGDLGKERIMSGAIGKALGYDVNGNYLKAYGGPLNINKKKRKR